MRAGGSFVETASGRRVLDFTAGQICATIGRNHPRVAAEIRRALDDSCTSIVDALAARARARRRAAGDASALADATIFLSTGGESIEVAVRMAKLYSGGFETRR